MRKERVVRNTRMPTFPALPQSSFRDAYRLVEILSPDLS